MTTDSEAKRRLELVTAILGLGSILLPVAGVVARWVAYWLGLGSGPALPVALNASVGLLSVTGLVALLQSLPSFVALTILFWFVRHTQLLLNARSMGAGLVAAVVAAI